jgi:hypothetical protein
MKKMQNRLTFAKASASKERRKMIFQAIEIVFTFTNSLIPASESSLP